MISATSRDAIIIQLQALRNEVVSGTAKFNVVASCALTVPLVVVGRGVVAGNHGYRFMHSAVCFRGKIVHEIASFKISGH
ncbi:hypothetical protein C3L33_23315, partial [Rhododendron williamsianum]